MEPIYFKNPLEFRLWLEENHLSATEVFVGFYKVATKKPSMTWSESVDQALCFGWIDGVRKSGDAESYVLRFTPRRKDSIWSAVNINKIETLSKARLMKPAGIAAFEKRKESKSRIYAFEQELMVFSPEFESAFKANEKAWNFFQNQAPWYKKTAIHVVMSPKNESTRKKWLDQLICDSAIGKRLDRLSR